MTVQPHRPSEPQARPWPNHRHVLPGFGLTLGLTLAYVGFLVLLPLTALFIKAAGVGWQELAAELASARTLAAFRITFGLSALAALLNGALGFLVAWVLVRYDFPGRKLMDAVIDLPFALPTAVAGITLASLYSEGGWLGRLLLPLGVEVAFKPAGIFLALVFIGLPFVVRTLQPLLADLDFGMQEAAWTLGATHRQTFLRVILPPLLPGLLTGMALAFARAVGEYGSVIFIAGNMPGLSEIVPLLIVIKLEQYNEAGAAMISCTMLIASFTILLIINRIERWTRRSHGG